MANQTQPATELDFFSDLNQSQLTELKNFWLGLDQLVLASKPVQKPTNTKIEAILTDRVKNLVGDEDRERFAKALWDWVMMDDPDKMVLKYIRAKKFRSTPESLELLINALKFKADRNLSHALHETPGILKHLKTGKAFVFGFDRSGSPIVRVNAAKHKTNEQTPKELEEFILYSMEVPRLFILPPAETVTMLIDLSGFGLSNMDLKCASFMISTLESYYPETLNHQIFHNAPWIFQGFWKAISPLMDPVVRSKVLFTSTNDDLSKLIDKPNLFKAEGGEAEFQWKIPANYPLAPGTVQAGTNDEVDRKRHLDLSPEQEEAKAKEIHTRALLVARFLSLTRLWLAASEDGSPLEKVLKILALRDLLKVILRAQYLKLMPLIKPKTIYHYRGMLDAAEPGMINFAAENGSAGNAWKGQEHARPSVLKTIESRIELFRSTYPLDPASKTTDPVENLFSEISQLDFYVFLSCTWT